MSRTVVLLFLALAVSAAFATGITSCQAIISSGPYQLSNNLQGAPISASPITGTACIRVNVSNVALDCAGHTILNNGTGGTTYGIMTKSSLTNVTVRNCAGIANYTDGILLDHSDHSVVDNSTTYNDSLAGIYIDNGTYDNVTNCKSYDVGPQTGGSGFYLDSNSYIVLLNDNATGNYDGYLFTSTNNDTVEYDNATLNTNAGFDISASSGNTVEYNNVFGNSLWGIAVYSSSNSNSVDENTISGASAYGIYLGSGSNNVFAGNEISGVGDGIYVLSDPGSSGNQFANGTIHDNTGEGLLLFAYNDIFTGMTIYNSSPYGFDLSTNSYNNTVTNNSAYNNDIDGFEFYVNSNNTITNNSAYNNFDGFLLSAIYNYTFTNNSAYNNTDSGFVSITSSNDTLTGNSAYNNTNHGFYLETSSNNNTLTGNTAYNNSLNGFDIDFSSNNTLIGNTACNNTHGFHLSTSSKFNTLTGNTACNNSHGFYLSTSSNNNTLTSNTAADNPQYGFYIDPNDNNNTLTNNTAYDSQYGFYFITSSSNTLANNTAYNNYFYGFDLWTSSNNNTLTGNTAYNNSQNGFGLYVNSNNTLTNNSAHDNFDGFLISDSSNNALTGNSAYNGNSYGIWVSLSNNTRMLGGHFYNNTHDLRVNENGESVNLSRVIFDNPAGDFTNFTNISLNHTITGSEVLSLSWSQSPAAPPGNYTDFAGKIISVSDAGAASFGKAVWSWRSDELTPFDNESTFGLWGYNGSAWVNTGASLDTVGHTLTLSGFNPSNTYDFGIFENKTTFTQISSCTVITYPAAYFQVANLMDAPYEALSGNFACVVVESSDVSFDCNHYNMTGTGASHTSGFFVNGSYTNVTIKNCDVSNYGSYGITTWNATDSVIADNILHNNSFGFVNTGTSARLSIANNTAYGDTAGFVIFGSSQNITNNTAYGNSVGFLPQSTSDVLMANNTAFNNSAGGLYLQVANRTTIINDHYYNNTPDISVANVSGQTYSINLSGVIIDNPAGGLANYTNISLRDTVGGNEAYALSWATNTTALPTGEISFQQKFVSITPIIGTPSIDQIAWQWRSDELGSHNPSKFSVWKYNASGWVNQSAVLDTGANTLTMANLNPASIYGILENNATENCPVITSSYTMLNNFTGAPNDAFELAPGYYACVKIGASNVLFDCDGHSITGNGSDSIIAIFLNGSGNNITVRNCPGISGYGFGAYDYLSSQSTYTNITAYNNTVGLQFLATTDNVISNSTLFSVIDGGYGIALSSDVNTTIANSMLYGGPVGISAGSSVNDTIINNTIYNNTKGIATQSISGFTIANNTMYNDSVAIYMEGSSYSSVTGNNLCNNSGSLNGFGGTLWLYSSFSNNVSGNTICNSGNGTGLSIDSFSSGNRLASNSIYNNSAYGIYIKGSSSGTSTTANTVYDNTAGGMRISGSNTTEMAADRYYNNGYDLLFNSSGASGDLQVNLSGVVFDNPAGTLSDYTNLTMSDIAQSEAYSINWSSNPPTMPPGKISFHLTFVNITAISGSVSIDSINWTWQPSQLVGFNDSTLELWKYDNSGWSDTGAALYPGIYTISLSNLVPSSIYGVFASSTLANLTIYSQYEYSSVAKLNPITFYANFTNATNGNHIPGATCNISFDDATSGTMVDTGSQYNYTKAAGFSTTGNHTWSVTCSQIAYGAVSASDGVLITALNESGNMTSLYMANVTNATALPRFEYNGSGNLSTEGGNISGSDIYTEQLTDRWAAFYGNITGSIMLTDAAGANNVYQWLWTPASGGVVCASTNSSVTDLTLSPADGDDIDSAWSFAPTEADSGRNTFNQTGCDLTMGTTPITDAAYADTGQPGGFATCSLKDTTNATKQDMYFCTNVTENGVFWNNELGDFELIVPTTFGNNVYETYYFYVNLD